MGRGFQNGQYAERKVEIVFGRGGGLGLWKINQQKCLSLFKNILQTISDKINFLSSLKSLNSFDCLFTFTSINGHKQFQQTASVESRRSARLSSPLGSPIGTTASWVYTEECSLCSKFRMSNNTSRVTPYSIKTVNAMNGTNAAAAVKNTKLMR